MCLSIPPKHAISEVMGTLKGKMSNKNVQQVSRVEEEVLGQSLLE